MKGKKNLFLAGVLLAVTALSTMAYAIPQEILRILPIDTILSSITKTADRPSETLPAAEQTKQKNTGGSVLSTEKSDKDTASEADTSKIPEQVTYLFLFKQLAAFEEKAKEVEAKGEDGSSYRTVYKRLAHLSNEHSEFLRKTALDCDAELKIKDKQAQKIGDRLRAEYEDQLSKGTAPPSPPPSPELAELQKQRDEIILKHRDSLKTNFGEAFEGFESYVRTHITSNIKIDTKDKAARPPVNMDRLTGKQQGKTDAQSEFNKESN